MVDKTCSGSTRTKSTHDKIENYFHFESILNVQKILIQSCGKQTKKCTVAKSLRIVSILSLS